MRIIISLLLILLVFTLVNTESSAQTALRFQVEPGAISGGQYQLVSSGIPADTVSTGGAYRLLGPATPSLRGSGCCCTYLPCALRNR